MNRRGFIAAAAASVAGTAINLNRASAAASEQPSLKLKYAIPTSFFRSGGRPVGERLELIREMGFIAVENNGMKRMDRKDLEAYGARLEELGMEHGVWVTNRGVNGGAGLVDPKEREEFFDELRSSIEVAPIVRGKFTTLTTGNLPARMTRSRAKLNLIETLKRAGEMVENTDLTLVIEPLNVLVDHPGYYLSRSDEAYEVMKAVGHPRVKILFDIYHQQITEGNVIRNIRDTYDETAYYQFADNPGRKEPGTGEMNYLQIFKAIYDLGFKGIVGAEMGQSMRGDEGSRAALKAIIDCDQFVA